MPAEPPPSLPRTRETAAEIVDAVMGLAERLMLAGHDPARVLGGFLSAAARIGLELDGPAAEEKFISAARFYWRGPTS